MAMAMHRITAALVLSACVRARANPALELAAASFRERGFCILRGAIPAALLGRLNDVFSTEIDANLSVRSPPDPTGHPGGFRERCAGMRRRRSGWRPTAPSTQSRKPCTGWRSSRSG